MIRKRLRMTLDFEVKVEELTDERLREYYRRSGEEGLIGDEELRENLTRQVRLQRALLEDEGALRRFLTYTVVGEVDPTLDGKLGGVFGVAGLHAEEEILGPVLARLGQEDARYFTEAIEAGALTDYAPALNSSCAARWVGARLDEVKVEGEVEKIAEGETLGNKESDNLP